MTTAQPVSVEARGLYKLFNRGHPTRAEYDGQILRVFGDGVGSFTNQQIDKVVLDLRWLHHALIVTLRSGNTVELSIFAEQDVRKLHAAVSDRLRRQRETEAKEHEARLQKQARTFASDIPNAARGSHVVGTAKPVREEIARHHGRAANPSGHLPMHPGVGRKAEPRNRPCTKMRVLGSSHRRVEQKPSIDAPESSAVSP